MDSTLLDQIRHLCRDRAAYEHLKAILVQQERVHQLSWEERYEKLMSAQASDEQTDLFKNIIAREKSLAQLTDAIQRSPSLELVLQVAVQVAQKLLQVDRVAIFRCDPDGRGEFVTDAIASGLTSLVDMPERQLTLAKHMMESSVENSHQSVDSIRSSSLSSHIVTLLEQIGISSYAVNKIYAGQDVWGTLVAFQGSAYHSWAESDRTSLSLIASQIGIAISLTNLRQQSQDLTQDLEGLQNELNLLQQAVKEISQQASEPIDADIEPLKTDELDAPSAEILSTESVELGSSSLTESVEDIEPIENIETIEVSEVIESEQNDYIEPSEISSITDAIVHEEIEQPVIPNESLIEEIREDQDLTEVLDADLNENLEKIEEERETDSLNVEQAEQILNVVLDPIEQHLKDNPEEILYSGYLPISNNGVPALFLLQNPVTDFSEDDVDQDRSEEVTPISTEPIIIEINQDHEIANSFLENVDAENVNTENIETNEIAILESSIPDSEVILEEPVTETVNSAVEEDISPSIAPSNVVEESSQHEELELNISTSNEESSESIDAKSIEADSTELETEEITPDTEELEVAIESETEAIAHVSEIPPENSEEIANVETEELNRTDLTSDNNSEHDLSGQAETAQAETVDRVVEQVESEAISQEITEDPQNDENLGSNTETFQDERKDEPEDHQEVSIETHAEITASQEIAEMPSEVVEPQTSEVPNETTTETEQRVAIAQPTPDDLTTIIIDPDEERDPAIEPQFIETILSISGDDSKGIKFLLGVIDTYLEDTPKLVQAIDKAIASNDHPKLLHLINTLRISSDYIGALALSYQCRQLESAVRANYVVLIYACLSQVAIEAQRATDALRIEREKYSE